MLKTIGAYAVSRILSGLLLYLTLVGLLYAFDKQSYEQFSAAYAAYQLISMLAFGWIYAIIPPMLAGLQHEERARKQAELVSAFAWMCVLALAAFAAASATGALDLPPLVVASAALAAIIASASEEAMTAATAREEPRLYFVITLVRYGAGLMLALAAAAFAMGAAGAFFGLAGGALAALAVADRPLQLRAGGLKPIGLRQLAGLLRTGLPAIVAFAVYPLAITVNRLVVAESCSLEAAAALGAVNDLVAGPVLLVFHVVNLALMPSVYAAANRGDGPVFERTIWQLVGLQAAVIIPGIAFFLLFGGMIGSVLHLTSLPPVAADMLPYIAIAVLSSVIINTAAGVAVARRKIGLATIYSLAVVGTSILLGLREGCDVLGLARTLTVLMAISSFVGLFFIYRLRKLPGGAEGEAAS